MVNDAILLAMTDEELAELVADALRAYKEEKDLASSALAESSLVLDCFMIGETPRPHLQALGVLAFLRWAVDQLWQGPKPGGQERGWRLYAVLYYPYVERKTFEEVADQLMLSTQAVYDWRLQALLEVAKVLRWELQQRQQQQQRKRYAIIERYRVYQPTPLDGADEQRLLRFCTLLRQLLPEQILRELMSTIGVTELQERIARLHDDGWLVQTGEDLATMLRPDDDARAYVRSRLTAMERRDWCNQLGHLYAARQDYVEAATQWCAAEQYQIAATMLIQHYREIVDAGQIKPLYELQIQFSAAQLDKTTLAHLKIAVGRAALLVENVDTAVKLLQEALSAPDSLSKAEAHYYLGKAFHNVRAEEARWHFDRGIQLLEKDALQADEQSTRLLADLYVGKAWLYILLLPDLAKAEDALQQAQTLIAKTDDVRWTGLQNAWVNLHNALAGLYASRGELQGELDHYYQAMMAAREVGDHELLWKTLHNLAQTYIHANRYELGLEYLAQAQAVALRLGNDEWGGKCAQTHGAACYYQGQYAEAIRHYADAAVAFAKTGNDHWLAAAYADLAEAYAALPDLSATRRYYREAMLCAQRAHAEDVIEQVLKKLASDHPELDLDDLNLRQSRALEVVRQQSAITSGHLAEMAEISKPTAERDLEKLVKLGLLTRTGKGRGTKYVLPSRIA